MAETQLLNQVFESQHIKVETFGDLSGVVWLTFGSLELGGPFGEIFIRKRNEGAVAFVPADAHWYQHEDIWGAIEVARELSQGASRRIAYGSSMGGFAALAFAKDLKADLVIAAAPQVSIDQRIVGSFDRRWADKAAQTTFERADARIGIEGEVHLIFDPLHHEDRLNSQMISDSYPCTRHLFPMAGHGVLHTLQRMSLLQPLISSIADGQNSVSEGIYKSYINLRRDRSDYYFALASKLKDRGRFDAALKFYLQALARSPKDHDCYHGLADCLWQTGWRAAAVEADTKCVELMPTIGGHWVRLILRLIDSARVEEAHAVTLKAIELLPNVAEIQNAMSIVYRNLNDLPLSLEHLEKAVSLNPHILPWHDDIRNLRELIASADQP